MTEKKQNKQTKKKSITPLLLRLNEWMKRKKKFHLLILISFSLVFFWVYWRMKVENLFHEKKSTTTTIISHGIWSWNFSLSFRSFYDEKFLFFCHFYRQINWPTKYPDFQKRPMSIVMMIVGCWWCIESQIKQTNGKQWKF